MKGLKIITPVSHINFQILFLQTKNYPNFKNLNYFKKVSPKLHQVKIVLLHIFLQWYNGTVNFLIQYFHCRRQPFKIVDWIAHFMIFAKRYCLHKILQQFSDEFWTSFHASPKKITTCIWLSPSPLQTHTLWNSWHVPCSLGHNLGPNS